MDNRESARAREIKNKGNQFRWKNNIQIFDKIRNGSGHQGGIKLTAAIKKKKKVNRNTFNISTIHVKRLTMKVFEASRCSRAKQRQGNVQKKKKKSARHLQSFLVIRPTYFWGSCFCCRRRLALR